MAERWARRYRSLGKLRDNPDYRNCFTYLDFDRKVRSMIYTTNWIERLNRDFRRVLRMRGSMPDEQSVITLMGYVAQNKKAYDRKLPRITADKKTDRHTTWGITNKSKSHRRLTLMNQKNNGE